MNSNDITVAMVTNVLQKEGKQNKTENQGKGIKWNKQHSIALAFGGAHFNSECFAIS